MGSSLGAAATLEDFDEPYALLARLREREPVSWVSVLDGWLVTRRDLAMEVMNAPETFTVDDPRFSTGRVVGRACSRSTAPSTGATGRRSPRRSGSRRCASASPPASPRRPSG